MKTANKTNRPECEIKCGNICDRWKFVYIIFVKCNGVCLKNQQRQSWQLDKKKTKRLEKRSVSFDRIKVNSPSTRLSPMFARMLYSISSLIFCSSPSVASAVVQWPRLVTNYFDLSWIDRRVKLNPNMSERCTNADGNVFTLRRERMTRF